MSLLFMDIGDQQSAVFRAENFPRRGKLDLDILAGAMVLHTSMSSRGMPTKKTSKF